MKASQKQTQQKEPPMPNAKQINQASTEKVVVREAVPEAKAPKKQSLWSKLFGPKRTVEKVSIVELATERREMNHQENTFQQQLEQARLDRYNERVKQRARQNAMQNQMQTSEPVYENQMSRF